MNTCIFCRILSGEIPCSKVYEDADIIAFLDVRPINEGHTLVIPKTHIKSLTDLPQELFGKIAEHGHKIASHFKKVIPNCEGISLSLADGDVAGQEVPHVHLHVIPRKSADGFGWRTPPSYGAIAERSSLEDTAKKIRESLNQ